MWLEVTTGDKLKINGALKLKKQFSKYSLNDAGNITSVRERNRQRKEKKKVKNMDGVKDYLAKK